MNVEIETVNFPSDFSLGILTVYRDGEDGPQQRDARGAVLIPKGAQTFLEASQDLCNDLTYIRTVPRALLTNGMGFTERDLSKTQFAELRGLDLNCIIFNSCDGIRRGQLLDLASLGSIVHLNLTRTRPDETNFSWITDFRSLKTLLLIGVEANDRCAMYVSELPLIEEVHFAYSHVSDEGVQAMWAMGQLKRVNLSKSQITNSAFVGMRRCQSLEALDVSGSRISDKGIELIVEETLKSVSPLRTLALRSCPVTDECIVRLTSLKNLTLMDLHGTDVTSQGIAFLKKSLPSCRVLVETGKR